MKAIGQKCGWVISKKERHVLKLLRVHARERDQEFVSKSSSVPRQKPAVIQAKFAPEESSAFQVPVRKVGAKPKPNRPPPDSTTE